MHHGQEIYLFFFSYGLEGIVGIVISSLIIGVVIYKTLKLVKEKQISTYKEFLEILIPKNKKIRTINNNIINIFIIITFFIMIAGFGAYFGQELGINNLIGSIILALITFILFMTNIEGIIKANELIVPFLIIFIGIIGIQNAKEINLNNIEHYIIRNNQSNVFLSSILYGGYNSILLIPMLVTLKDYCKSEKQIKKISIIVSIITIILAILIYGLLIRVDVNILNLEMPAVYVVTNYFKMWKYIYGFIILGSIFTTAISLGNSFLQNVAKNKKSYTQVAAIMCISSIGISQIGFSNLVGVLYPLFGCLGLIQIIKLVLIKYNTA